MDGREPTLNVLALDIAPGSTGWAIGTNSDKRFLWGTYEAPHPWSTKSGHNLVSWRDALSTLISNYQINYIAKEELIIKSGERDFNWDHVVPNTKLHGCLEELAQRSKIPIGRAPVNAWRKHFLGLGALPESIAKADRRSTWKTLAVKACAARGWYTASHDEAEALAILDFTLAAKDADYRHRVGPHLRRQELQVETKAFRGELS